MLPLGLTINGLARALDVPATRIHSIVHGERAISADTAARLARHFGGDAASWLALRATHDLEDLAQPQRDRAQCAAPCGGVGTRLARRMPAPARHARQALTASASVASTTRCLRIWALVPRPCCAALPQALRVDGASQVPQIPESIGKRPALRKRIGTPGPACGRAPAGR
ncbi:HigA family addiction module antitoxin [Xanthomonas hortorum pv. pelargonii]|nr:HigA family addiction module antitoxin [Xanthomonas hortorum pv. pelargonii]